MKTFIIDRKTWLRGEESINSRLLRHDGLMCCLGQIACEFGYTKDEILGIGSPEGLSRKKLPNKNKFFEKFLWLDDTNNNLITSKMMSINDDKTIHDSLREEELMGLAAKMDIKLDFIN